MISDPPYARADLPLYGILAKFAMRVLKPGGWCIAMTGGVYLDRIMALITASGPRWREQIVVSFPNRHARNAQCNSYLACRLVLTCQQIVHACQNEPERLGLRYET